MDLAHWLVLRLLPCVSHLPFGIVYEIDKTFIFPFNRDYLMFFHDMMFVFWFLFEDSLLLPLLPDEMLVCLCRELQSQFFDVVEKYKCTY